MSRLVAGSPAPDFVLSDSRGREVRLSALRGAPVWLAFYRYAACPFCNLRVHRVIERLAAGGFAGVRLLGVFQSSPASMAEYVGKQEPPFPLLCDPSEEVYGRYGLEHGVAGLLSPALVRDGLLAARLGYLSIAPEGTFSRLPADFVIDARGVVREAYYGRHISDHIPFERVDAALAPGAAATPPAAPTR